MSSILYLGFTIRVVSEGSFDGIEYTVDGPSTPSLFFLDGERLLGVPWWRGINIVVIDVVYGTVLQARVNILHISSEI